MTHPLGIAHSQLFLPTIAYMCICTGTAFQMLNSSLEVPMPIMVVTLSYMKYSHLQLKTQQWC